MKKFMGSPHHFQSSITGIIRKKPESFLNRIFLKHPTIRTIESQSDKFPKTSAFLVNNSLQFANRKIEVPYIDNINPDNLNSMSDGDVVMLLSDGTVNVLYEVNSAHNVIFATGRCNLKCLMCPQPYEEDKENLVLKNLNLIDMMDKKSTTNLAITGGEPTLLGDGLITILDACKKRLPQTRITLLTNGTKLSDIEYVKKIALINHPMLFFAIPLYSDVDLIHDEIVGVRGSFYKAIKGMYNLALLKQNLEIRTVIIKSNYERLENFAEYIYKNLPFSNHIALMGMETTGLARENIQMLWIDPFDYMNQLERAIKLLYRANMNLSIYNIQRCILPRHLWQFARKSISSWKNIYIEHCSICSEKNNCCGFFSTGGEFFSSHIKPIEKYH
jgi:His-Xaa-Ser system radical SAM maturase HxsC